MMSITTILILFTAFIAISGEIIDLRSGINRSRPRVSYLDELFHLKYTVPKYDKLYSMRPLHTSFDEFQTSPTADTTNKRIVSRQEILRIRRQALVKTRGTDGGSAGSIMPLRGLSFNIHRGGIQPITTLKIIAWMHRQLGIELMKRIRNGDVPREFVLARPDINIERF
ncbi:uncharacterized protein LOC114129508 [Aphis gossypii]|uniref:uncharacterized protein LOC114129508 n=1 Tax=Aphis gossypii TaxID=80765 RepID=UPI0021594281|nr:uncharacterized protein LOC114129508 [Aphis gossypii]